MDMEMDPGPGDNDTREICEKFTIILPGRQKESAD